MSSVLLTLTLLLPEAEPSAPAAMVLSSKGDVTLQRGDAPPRKAWAMAILQPGDGLRAAEGAEAVLVFLEDGHRERLKAGAQATVQAAGLTPAGGAERPPGPKLTPANLQSLRDLARSARGGVGVLRGDTEVRTQVIAPMYGTVVLTDRPEFSWPAADRADIYLVELLSGPEGRDQRTLWKAETKETRLPYPEKQKSLKAGLLYRWRVSPVIGEDRGEPTVVSKFSLLTRGEAAALANLKDLVAGEAPEDWATAAALYEAHGAYGEALPLYERLAERFPQDPAFQHALVSYYERAGRPDRAREARARAGKLGAATSEQ